MWCKSNLRGNNNAASWLPSCYKCSMDRHVRDCFDLRCTKGCWYSPSFPLCKWWSVNRKPRTAFALWTRSEYQTRRNDVLFELLLSAQRNHNKNTGAVFLEWIVVFVFSNLNYTLKSSNYSSRASVGGGGGDNVGLRRTSNQTAQAGPVQRKLFFHSLCVRACVYIFMYLMAWCESPCCFWDFSEMAALSVRRRGLPLVVGGT